MSPQFCVLLASVGWGAAQGPSLILPADAGDEQTLRAAGLAADGPALLAFFRKQTASDAVTARGRELIRQLGADTFAVREKASADLVALGPVILPLLRQAMREAADLEVRRRARACVEQLRTEHSPAVAAAAARLLALRKPPGAAEALLNFLPGPYAEGVTEDVQTALVAVARPDGRPDPIFLANLTSPVPARRSAAAVTLCRAGAVEQRPAVRKLLRDEDSTVCLQVAEELAIAGDREAVPVLIDLLGRMSPEQAGRAEDLLYRLAGAQAPQVPLGDDAAGRRRCLDAWADWWRRHGERVEMAALQDAERTLGYTLLVLLNANRVVEWGRDSKPRWQIDGLASPLDAEVLSGSRVLIAEHDSKRVSERNLKGDVLWEKKLSEPPIHAHRLPGGATFIVTRKVLLEVDRGGRELVRYRSGGEIITARRYRDGRIGCVERGTYFELSPDGSESRRFAIPSGVFTTNALTLLSNGHLLLAAYGGGTVQEYDRAGKVVWEVKMGRPLCPLRLPGGNTLVSSQDMVLVEFDRSGKEVGRHAAEGHPCQIRHR